MNDPTAAASPDPGPRHSYRGYSDSSVPHAADEEEVPLYESSREREVLDEQANLFGIVLATEHLERAYARDAITQQEYVAQCKKLISQFKLAERVLLRGGSINSSSGGSSGGGGGMQMSTEAFMELYQLDCPRAAERLLRMGVPEPIKGGAGPYDAASHAVTVAETVQHFITAMDAVKLEQRAVDELQPLLSDLADVLARVPDTPNDFEPNRKVQKWLQKLNAMRAVEEIGEDDSRQLYMDLDSAYTEFTRYLKRGT